MPFYRLPRMAAAAPLGPRALLVRELAELQRELDQNERLFNMTDDFDLTEYAIHQRSALFMRHRFLLEQIRLLDAAGRPAPETVLS